MNSKLLKLKRKLTGEEDTVSDLLIKVNKILKSKQGDKGDTGKSIKGDKGDTPVKGTDYFTKDEIKAIEKNVRPIKGVDYYTEEEVKDFKNSCTPIKDKDYFDGDKGDKGDSIKGDKGDAGEDADQDKITEDTINVIVEKFSAYKKNLLEELGIKFTKREKEVMKKLEMKLAMMVQRLQVHGGGLSRAEIIALIAGAGGGNAGRTDLSAQCNSVTMVFTMDEAFNAGTEIIRYSSFPFIYRPGVDYTVTGANQITFVGAEVTAPKTGQTLVSSYEKA